MNLSALIDWFDDRINPIVIKELRQAVKSRMVVAILMLFLGLQLFLLGVFLLMREAQGSANGNGGEWNAGSGAFMIQQVILLWTIAVLVPAYAAIRMGAERLDKNVDLMFISTLRPSSIVWGKFFATLTLGLLVFSTCAPFMTFTYLLRGIDIPTILLVLGIDLLTMLFGIMAALFLAALPGAMVLKFVYAFFGFLGLTSLTMLLTGATVSLIEGFGGFFEAIIEFWPVTLSFVAGVFAIIGLIYCYSVAVISPPSSNRMMYVRVFLLGLCVVTLGGALVSSFYVPRDVEAGPILIFLMVVTPILCLQFLISICERDQWGPRILRTVPRNVLLRLPAFLFYSGSAGGMLFSILLTAACLLVCLLRAAFFTPGRGEEMVQAVLLAHVITVLYVFCYSQTATLVRRYLLNQQIRVGYTWVVAGLLVGLGTTIPPIFAYFLYSDQMRYGNDVGWWFIPNPFISYINIVVEGRWRNSRVDDYEFLCLWFLLTWAAILTLLSIPWLAEQMRAFRPAKNKPAEEFAEVILVDPQPRVGVQG